MAHFSAQVALYICNIHTSDELYKKLRNEMNLNCSYSDIKGVTVATYLVDKIHIAFDNAQKLNISDDVHTNIHHHIKDIFNTDKL